MNLLNDLEVSPDRPPRPGEAVTRAPVHPDSHRYGGREIQSPVASRPMGPEKDQARQRQQSPGTPCRRDRPQQWQQQPGRPDRAYDCAHGVPTV